jgi:hypothetical protein
MLLTRLRAVVGIVALSTLLLAGCAVGSDPQADSSRAAAPDPKKLERAEEPIDEDDLPDDFSFEGGAELSPDLIVQWTDGFGDDDRFSVESPDDGNGGWSYRDEQTQCVIRFWQGALTDMERSAGDREASDAFLAGLLGVPVDQVRSEGRDDSFLDFLTTLPVEMRTVSGATEDGGSWVDSARAFTALGSVVYVSVECPAGQSAADVRQELVDGYYAMVAVTPAF